VADRRRGPVSPSSTGGSPAGGRSARCGRSLRLVRAAASDAGVDEREAGADFARRVEVLVRDGAFAVPAGGAADEARERERLRGASSSRSCRSGVSQ
jgi:hypothetical protein